MWRGYIYHLSDALGNTLGGVQCKFQYLTQEQFDMWTVEVGEISKKPLIYAFVDIFFFFI